MIVSQKNPLIDFVDVHGENLKKNIFFFQKSGGAQVEA